MFKLLKTLFTSICIASCISALLGLGFLWYRGQLTMQTLRDIRVVLQGGDQSQVQEEADQGAPQASLEDVVKTRVKVSADFNNKERELTTLEGFLNERATRLQMQKAEFDSRRKSFQEELERLRAEQVSAATEQGRGILIALPSREAADRLMQLSLDENVVLLKGMSEKIIARILKEFKGEEKRVKRGNEIFEKLTNGGRIRQLIDEQSRQKTNVADAAPPVN